MESYALAAFRSRQAVLRFEEELRRAGVPTRVVTTPRAVSLGCASERRSKPDRLLYRAGIGQKTDDPKRSLLILSVLPKKGEFL